MDGIEGTIKNMVFRKVLSGTTVLNVPTQLTEFTNILTTIFCLY